MKRKKAIALMVTVVILLVLAGSAAGESTCVRYGVGYWKQYLGMQDGNELAPCEMFTYGQLLDMMNEPARGDASIILNYQFIAAYFNMAVNECEMDDETMGAFFNAMMHLIFGAEADRQDILAWKDILEAWNKGC